MTYCINPHCQHRKNSEDAVCCQSCGTSLVIRDRYRLITPLRECNGHYIEVFEVQDLQNQDSPKVLKVVTNDDTQILKLFRQEHQILTNLIHAGIPRGEDAFPLCLNNQQPLHCLVMEKIQGQTLEQWLEQHGAIAEAQAIEWLTQITKILLFIHQKNLFHRDIKPSNIMLQPDGQLVLIDFGTARQLTETVIGSSRVTIIYSGGYTAPEQLEGRAVPQSDFFALGRTFVHLLTGEHPNKLDLQQWRQQTQHPISPALAKLIDDLMAVSPKDRPKTPQIVLRRIQRKFPWRRVAGAAVLSVAGVGLIAYTNHVSTHRPVCDSQIGDHLSCGEEILLPNFSPALSDKQRGVEAFTTGNYPRAKLWFAQAWNKERDPETLIYLNNARVSALRTAQSPVYTIAAVIPISTPSRSSVGQQILWGIAQAQDNAIQQGVNLQILLADDGNDPTQGQQIADALVKRSGVLSVIGHYASEVTVAVVPTYQNHQLVLVSPTSVADSLSAQSQRPDHVFFRTTWTTRLAAKMLIDHLIKQSPQAPAPKVAVFYNPDSEFSISMQQQFAQQLAAVGGQVVTDPNLSLADFDAKSAIARVRQQGATALAVFPDGHTYRYTFPNALGLIEENRGRDWVLGASTLYDTETLGQVGKAALNRFVVSAFWHPLSSPNPKFSREARQYWKGDVGIRTATSYDAVQVLVAALKQQAQPSRVGIRQVLANPKFEAKGATGTIRFNGSDRREELNTLIKVVSRCSKSGFVFVPVDYAKSCY